MSKSVKPVTELSDPVHAPHQVSAKIETVHNSITLFDKGGGEQATMWIEQVRHIDEGGGAYRYEWRVRMALFMGQRGGGMIYTSPALFVSFEDSPAEAIEALNVLYTFYARFMKGKPSHEVIGYFRGRNQ